MSPEEKCKAYNSVFSGKGLEVYEDIMKMCGTDVDTFSSDPYVNAYNSGVKSVGYTIKAIVEMDKRRADIERLTKDAEDKEK